MALNKPKADGGRVYLLIEFEYRVFKTATMLNIRYNSTAAPALGPKKHCPIGSPSTDGVVDSINTG